MSLLLFFRLFGEQQLNLVANLLGSVSQSSDLVNNVVHKNHIDRGQISFQIKQFLAQLELFFVDLLFLSREFAINF